MRPLQHLVQLAWIAKQHDVAGRTAGRDALMPAVLEIVETEGPVLAGRAFGLYTRASGGKKLTGAARAPLTGAAFEQRPEDFDPEGGVSVVTLALTPQDVQAFVLADSLGDVTLVLRRFGEDAIVPVDDLRVPVFE